MDNFTVIKTTHDFNRTNIYKPTPSKSNDEFYGKYMDDFFSAVKSAEFEINNVKLSLSEWTESLITKLHDLKMSDKKIYVIGNGASSSMASHFATDFTKNAAISSFLVTDPALLTCFSNDYSYEEAYKKILSNYMRDGDMLIAISSSGASKNITNAVNYLRGNLKGVSVLSLSGFSKDNPLRATSDYSLYVDRSSYGVVESSHAFFLHMLVDSFCHKENASRSC